MNYAAPFHHCPACGSRPFNGSRDRRMECAACGFILFLNVGAAAALIIRNPRNELLLIRRAKDPGKGKLGVPGGFVDPGEPIESALRREVSEEVGLEVEHIDFLASFPNDYGYGGVVYPTIDLYFTAEAASFDLATPLDEVDALVVLPLNEIQDDALAFPSLRQALAAYRTRQA